ncbi:hypothetical protein ACQ4PT_046787 [Festuca glaucescens]
MSKRRRSDDDGGPRSRRSERRRRHHLYFVVDDWTNGYSIYKVDVADLDGDPGTDLDSQANRPTDPPVFRLECPRNCAARFAAVGTKIIAMNYSKEEEGAPVLVYDTAATGGLGVGPRTPKQVREGSELVPAGDRLYVMSSTSLYKADDHLEVLAADEKVGWAWNAVPAVAPFNFRQVACDAAHPDGHTVFFSVHQHGTYSFDTETREWKRHGDWLLPFRGRAYYDGEVDAWVGLYRDSSEPGSVCSCDVVSAAGEGEGLAPPAWKLAKEKMVCEDKERTNAVVLARMGRGKFCLVEHRSRKGAHEELLDSCYLLYVTKFKLRYDKDGSLRATARRTRSYIMPRVLNTHNWWVFGI